MVGANVKQETFTLMDKKAAVEVEMEAIISRLRPPTGPGLTGNLMDEEGFPRADIDIPAVRADRQRVAVLRNDLKKITDQIGQNLHVLHSGSLMRDSSLPQKRSADGEVTRPLRFSPAVAVAVAGGPSSSYDRDEPVNMEIERTPLFTPFAVFDEVTPGSPAEEDGIKLGRGTPKRYQSGFDHHPSAMVGSRIVGMSYPPSGWEEVKDCSLQSSGL
ncbi:hypothetical protein R1sor_023262 [Riccia sorocarpa]|uniref:Nas2 N-terminal domain-containing protein n=1 Tax=Riccia sorocarpa TaxID=122646 RepID=A0ABD3GR51_9MARC